MKNTLLTYIDRYRHDRHDRLVLGSVLLFLAVFVTLFVYWQLRYVGVTMTNETYCGYEEHVHTEECYEYALVCGYEEGEVENPEITHVHTDECYLKESVLICGLEESDEHTHDESCYETQSVLICNQEEATIHVHTDECYELQLACGYEEHTHTVSCMIDESADLEDATVWEATIPMLSGDLRTDIVTVAYSQLGYTESTANYVLGDDGLTRYGYTRYGAWYGNSYSDWDSMFVSFCLDYAGIADEFTYNAGAYAWTIDLANLGYYQTSDVYSPSVGDVVFIDTDLDGKANITAIVVAIDESVITVIQGNYSATDSETGETVDTVSLVSYATDEQAILGYANVTYTGEEETEAEEDEEVTIDEEEEEVSEEPTTLTYDGADYTITVTYGEDAALPEGTELVAYEYAQDSETFLSRYEEASALYGWEDTDSDTYHGFRLFNIGLYYDGAEIEPSASVTVTVTYTGETDDTTTTVSVTHFSDTDTETLDATLTEGSVTFASDTFSDFGIALASEEDSGIATVAEEVTTSYTLVEVDVAEIIDSLDGRSFIITGNTRTRAMQATASGYGMASVVVADTDVSELTLWTFTSDGNGYYYISSGDSYLQMSARNSTDGTLSLVGSTEATAFTVYAYEKNSVTYMVISATVGGYTYYINKSGGDSSSNAFVAYYKSPENGGSNSQVLIYAVSDPYDDYDSADGFVLTIYGSDDQTNSIYSETVDDVWTDGTYYYIPISYFEDKLSTDEYPYSFDSSSTVTCPFMYAPDGSKLMGTKNAAGNYNNVTSSYYAFYAQIGDDWYLKVTDTTGGTYPRADVYYCPAFEYYFYIGSVNSSSVTGSGTDHVNYGEEIITDFAGYENYTLIPIKYFSGHIVESSLTATDTLTINGESYGYCTATDFQYKTRRWSADVATPVFVYYNDAWYLRVQDNSVGYTLRRIGIIGYTGNVGVYTTESSFYLWIYDSDLTKVAGYSVWDSDSGTNFSSSGITDVISYTDPDSGETYYYIPVSYFESALSSLGYDSTDILSRSLLYAPNANYPLSNSTSYIAYCLFADYEEIDGELYVRVTDTTGTDPHRVNVYFCPEYVYNIYVGTDSKETDSVEEVTISEYIGLGNKYVLIPVSNFDNFFDESSLDASTMATVTDDFTGYELTLYESPFQYKADWSGSTISDAYYYYSDGSWYLLVQYTSTSYSIPLRNKIWYTASVSGVVLNLTNGNGSAEFTHYGQNAMRYTVDLSAFADSDGSVTITLPSESDLNSTFVVAQNSADSVSVELGSESAYDYKLVGWFNIATGEYYDVSGGSVSVTVDIDDYYNVFYADWIADSYDFVEDTGASNIIETSDTSSFVTIQMFDFNELFNLYSESLVQNSLTSETWTDSGEFYSEPLLAKDATALTSIGNSFIFFDTDAPDSTTTGRLELPSGRKLWSYWTGASVQTDSSIINSAYTGLYDTDILEMLYSTEGSTLGSYYVGEANYLFTYDSSTGFYEYGASENAAVYQQSDERFYVYEDPQYYYSSGKSTGSIFLPFNSYNSNSSAYTYSNGEINYWFGVKIDLTFYLPNDTGVGGNQINSSDMIFEFEGDDDVWVLVDDELVLDLGGIHSAIKGEINFSTGQVIITDAKGNVTYKDISDILGDDISAGTHTLTFYYMERGASASNMRITLNTIPSWKYETSTVGTMEVEKVWVDNDDADGIRPDSIVVGLFEQTETYASYVASNALVYVYNDVIYEIDDDGYSYDSNDLVNAYISSGYIYVRVDTVTLSDSNDWSYLWKLLDSEKSEHYQILELSTYSYYTTTSSHETLTEYETYWSVEGDDVLNGDVTINPLEWTGILANGLEIVLTDGAQNGTADKSDFPTTYNGYAIYVKSDGTIGTVEIDFSQAAEEETDSSGVYTYGVTVDVPDEAIWTVEMTGGYDSFTENQVVTYVPTFYLKSSTGKYLAIVQNTNSVDDYSLELVDAVTDATVFSYNSLGELNTVNSTGLKVVINADGSYALIKGREGTVNVLNVKIFTPTTTTIGSSYTITNTILPSITLEKVETGNEDTKLSGVQFAMYQKDSNDEISGYYTFVNGEVVWADALATMTTGTDGTITYKYLPDGTYYLSEISTLDGYNLMTDELWFTISGGEVTAVSDSIFISIDADDPDNMTIIVRNNPGVELPSTGSAFTPETIILAGLLVCMTAVILIGRRRRREER